MERNLNLICTNNGKAYFDGFYYNGKLLIEVGQLYDYGFSCHNCRYSFDCNIYKESIACKCDLRRKHKTNIETIGDSMSRVDGRMICEFYELKRPTDLDSIKKEENTPTKPHSPSVSDRKLFFRAAATGL